MKNASAALRCSVMNRTHWAFRPHSKCYHGDELLPPVTGTGGTFWVRLPFFFSAELLLARLMTYFPTPGDNVLLCKMPLNIPPSIFLSACGKVFSSRFPPAKVRKPVRNTCSRSACGIVIAYMQFVMGLCSLTAWSCGMFGGFLEGLRVRKTDWFL